MHQQKNQIAFLENRIHQHGEILLLWVGSIKNYWEVSLKLQKKKKKLCASFHCPIMVVNGLETFSSPPTLTPPARLYLRVFSLAAGKTPAKFNQVRRKETILIFRGHKIRFLTTSFRFFIFAMRDCGGCPDKILTSSVSRWVLFNDPEIHNVEMDFQDFGFFEAGSILGESRRIGGGGSRVLKTQ